MKVIWHSQAQKGRRQVSAYIHSSFGIKRVKKFRQEVDDTVSMLKRHPNIGSIDQLYADRPGTYRSIIINSLSKWFTALMTTLSISSVSGIVSKSQKVRSHRQIRPLPTKVYSQGTSDELQQTSEGNALACLLGMTAEILCKSNQKI